MRRLESMFPLIGTLRRYRRADLRPDVVAGITTGVMLVPQSMAYAMLAGLPPIVGLYASVAPLIVYAALGSSRQLAVGPVAMDSLLVAAGVSVLAPVGSAEFIAYAVLLAAMVGLIQIAMGAVRAGFLVNFLSRPVISGFTSAAALIIGLSQLKHLLGIDLPRGLAVHEIAVEAARRLGAVDPWTALLGIGSAAALVVLKRRWPRVPRALVVVAAGTLAVWGLGLGSVAAVGQVPSGLPAPRIPDLDLGVAAELLPIAITIALVAFMEAVSVAKTFARQGGYEISPNRELVAIGAANVGGSLFGGYPVTGGFSRSAVNANAGARTVVAGLVTASVVVAALVLLTPLFTHLPRAVLAAIIMTAVFGLIDLREVRHLWRVKRSDLALLGVTFGATLVVGIQWGIAFGVGASLLVFVVRSTRPHTAVLGRKADGCFRNLERHPDAEPIDGLLIVRMDASFYFGNVTFLKDTLRRLEAEATTPVRGVILDFSAINDLDSSADAALREVWQDYQARNIQLVLARVKGPVMDVMSRSGFAQNVGPLGFTECVEDAVARLAPPDDRPRLVGGRLSLVGSR